MVIPPTSGRAALTRARCGFGLIAVAAVLMFVTSMRIQVMTVGGETVWAYGWRAAALPGVAAGLALVAGALFAMSLPGWARVFAVLPVLLGLGIGLTAYDTARDRVVISPTGLVVPGYGLLPRPEFQMRFDEVGGVMVLPREQQVVIYREDRSEVTIPMGDLVRAALPRMIEALRAHGVVVAED